MKIEAARFEVSAFQPDQEPTAPGADVVFLGRSNVGKSSLINRLLGVRGLARTSSTPGRTQSVNFYRVNERFNFVDLPGYGYAKVPERVRRAWKPMVEGTLERRLPRIVAAILVIDARHDPTALDRTMRDWVIDNAVTGLVAATKVDKLSGNARAKSKRALQKFVDEHLSAPPVLVSSTTGQGIPELWRHLDPLLNSP